VNRQQSAHSPPAAPSSSAQDKTQPNPQARAHTHKHTQQDDDDKGKPNSGNRKRRRTCVLLFPLHLACLSSGNLLGPHLWCFISSIYLFSPNMCSLVSFLFPFLSFFLSFFWGNLPGPHLWPFTFFSEHVFFCWTKARQGKAIVFRLIIEYSSLRVFYRSLGNNRSVFI